MWKSNFEKRQRSIEGFLFQVHLRKWMRLHVQLSYLRAMSKCCNLLVHRWVFEKMLSNLTVICFRVGRKLKQKEGKTGRGNLNEWKDFENRVDSCSFLFFLVAFALDLYVCGLRVREVQCKTAWGCTIKKLECRGSGEKCWSVGGASLSVDIPIRSLIRGQIARIITAEKMNIDQHMYELFFETFRFLVELEGSSLIETFFLVIAFEFTSVHANLHLSMMKTFVVWAKFDWL